mmetsp:Transcript_32802/g.76293  ORF Transcript_32802/g.76293 Transcript_32802/m.76293 type:complete len:636 (+) Transcript_32802:31-1938(+)|eukprot:CAMPEP_0171106704 /NCGR_PEP_ID=MMETSP0766_2-20121228/65315_1 /TAXON_ID=439317 /ORGANISM="Gambierdiscus australes, Strain CAWD 149" /LENGTH=635 /DNA_ID=CAMNT_0011567863 /DNA_START=21 /DNA_END=1928 /DNA_ORIENTATION=-
MRVAIACNGTRGDFQPYLSLAVMLQKSGHAVQFYTSKTHKKMAEDFDFQALDTSGDMEVFLKGSDCQAAMDQGDFALVAGNLSEFLQTEEDPDIANARYAADLRAFNPDVLLFNSIGMMTFGTAVNLVNPAIPRIEIELQPQGVASNDYKSAGFQRELPDPDTPCIMTFLWGAFNGMSGMETFQKLHEQGVSKEEVLKEMDTTPTPEFIFECVFEPDKWLGPLVLAYSPSFWENPADWPKSDNIKVIGNFKLSKETQNEYTQKGSKYFTSGADYELCKEFIAKNGPPVYVGWGSMHVYSKRHMTLLAVEALKRAGEKAVILGGWAKIDLDGLDGVDNEQELKDWCKDNILFIKAAPHELLFPQCKACIHHGGIGTLQVSLSSGCPTVITPVFADQFDNARHLTQIECGLSTTRLGLLKSDELGDAIKTICSDAKFKANCTALGEKMQKEDGVSTMVSFLEKWHAEEIVTGNWVKRRQANQERLYALRQKNNKLSFPQLQAKFTSVLNSRYPAAKAFNLKNMSFMGIASDLCGQSKLWWVKGASTLARSGEGLKTPEVGRFKKFAFLQELARDKKGTRLHVKRLRGRGPDEGWVTTTVNGKDIVCQITNPMEIGAVSQQEWLELFSDLSWVTGTSK